MLGFCVGFVAARSFCAWIFRFSDQAFGKWSVQPWAFLMYVENLEMNNSLKWALFIKVSGQITSNTLWKRGEVFFFENLTYFFIPEGGRKYAHTNSYNSAMTVIA